MERTTVSGESASNAPGLDRALEIIAETVPMAVLIELANALEVKGAGSWDFSKPRHYYIGAKMRHFGKWLAGEEYDRKDGQQHLAADAVRSLQLISKDLLGSK